MERSPPGSQYDTCETDMKITEFLTAALFLAGAVFQANASDIPRGEYPRPQFERTAWMNLNGVWDYTFDFSGSGLERGLEKATAFEGRITVPFCPESSLSGVGYTDFINCIWYHREVAVPEAWRGKDILLNFGAVYYNAEVYVDGVFAARHIGGSSSFSVDLTRLVTPGKSHHLVVRATSDVRSTTQGAGKQNLQYASYGCNYTRTTGIWQTVWMEAVDPAGLLSAHVVTDIDQGQLVITPRFRSESGNTLHIAVKEGGKVVAILGINYDISSLLMVESAVRELTAAGDSTQTEPEKIINVNDVLDELIAQSVALVGKPAALMNKEDKMRAIGFLSQSGAFLVTKSGDKVAKYFGISKYTLYSYIDKQQEDKQNG